MVDSKATTGCLEWIASLISCDMPNTRLSFCGITMFVENLRQMIFLNMRRFLSTLYSARIIKSYSL